MSNCKFMEANEGHVQWPFEQGTCFAGWCPDRLTSNLTGKMPVPLPAPTAEVFLPATAVTIELIAARRTILPLCGTR